MISLTHSKLTEYKNFMQKFKDSPVSFNLSGINYFYFVVLSSQIKNFTYLSVFLKYCLILYYLVFKVYSVKDNFLFIYLYCSLNEIQNK